MTNIRHNAEAEIYHELKYHSLCKLLQIEPDHTCTVEEMAKNLKMNTNAYLKKVKQMVKDGKIEHSKRQSQKFKSKKRDVYTVIDRRYYQSKDLIVHREILINENLDTIRKLGMKMKDRPAMKMKLIRINKEVYGVKVYQEVYQGIHNKLGLEYLDQFCTIVNSIFSFIDSMTYASLWNTLDSDEKTVNVIIEIRIKTLNEISDIIESIFESYEEKLRTACFEMLMMRIPTYFMINQLQRVSNIRV